MKRPAPRARALALAVLLLLCAAAFGSVAAAAQGTLPPISPRAVAPGLLLASLSDPGGRLGDSFGNAVAISGNTAVIGAYSTNGAQGVVYIFVKGTTHWPTTPTVTLTDPAAGGSDLFGYSVAIAGSTIVVGAYGTKVGSVFSEGAAYIYVKGTTKWPTKPTVTLHDPNGATGDLFGSAVDIASGNIIVGAYGVLQGGNQSAGAAYIYTRNASGHWPTKPTVKLADPPATAYDLFGSSVALYGGTAVVGALNGNAAYIYTRNASKHWPTKPNVTLADPAAATGDYFGCSLALGQSTLVVGADSTSLAQGAAYIYQKGAKGWPKRPTVTLSDPTAPGVDEFGISVSFSGSVLVVGSDEAQASGAANGAAYYYVKGTKGWPKTPTKTVFDPGASSSTSYPGDRFGSAAAVGANAVVVGAFFTYGTYSGSVGAAYIYTP